MKVVRVGTKKNSSKNENVTPQNAENINLQESFDVEESNAAYSNDKPTCIRCYTHSEKDIQNINGIIMRFNVGKTDFDLQRVGYKMIDEKSREIDIAILHAQNYSIKSEEYAVINKFLSSALEENEIEFDFIDFGDSHKNTADGWLKVDNTSTLGEFITIEKGSVSDELFNYIRSRTNLPVDIVSIRIPITAMGITYETQWVNGIENDIKKNEDLKSDNTVNISVFAYTEDASDNIDTVLSQFGKSIGRSMCDYTEKTDNGYFRVIRMSVILDESGVRLIDSLGWIKDIIVSEF